MTRTIIAGFDGTDRGRDALALARMLADTLGGRLLVASVYAYEAFEMPPAIEGYRALMHDQASEAIAAAREIARPDDTRVLGATSPARALNDLAEKEEAVLIVVGSTSRGAVGRVLPGSVGERLLNGAPCAVAVAPLGFADPSGDHALTPLGVAYDGLPQSRPALDAAAELARALDAPLRAITVFDRPAPADPYFAFVNYRETVEMLRAGRIARLREAVADACAGVETESVLIDGSPVTALADASHELGLLVLGSRGYGPARRVLLGGVSGRLLHEASCAVILVPHAAQQPLAAAS